ncbi:MAG: hypothetical protein HY080_11180 [Gammaproteobacteria bacterium]|nr:hypothetical protein [Gammaproteobacteria bacterium]
MDALRLSLLIVGIVIIAGVYWWSRRSSAATREVGTAPQSRQAPLFNASAATPADATPNLARMPDGISPRADVMQELPGEPDSPQSQRIIPSRSTRAAADVLFAAYTGEQLIVSLTVMGRHGKRFTGESILEAMRAHHFEFGEMRIFQHFAATPTHEQPILNVANILEPGVFDLDKMRTFDTPGLVVFMRLPGPLEPRVAFENLLTVGRGLAEHLHGDLCDESRSVLTPQTIGYLREKLEAFRFKQQMAQLGKSE